MEKFFHKTILIIAFLALLSGEAYALNMGSLVKEDYANITAGDTANFRMLFWNSDAEPYDVELLMEGFPDAWTVTVEPDQFTINSSIGEEYVTLSYVNQSVLAKVVNIAVETKSDSKPGIYDILLKAKTLLPSNDTGNFEIVPERIFNFQIEIEGAVVESLPEEETEIESVPQEVDIVIDKTQLYLIIASIIFVFSIIIYKMYNN